MDIVKYHPLVDADSEGTCKIPMFFSDKAETVTAYSHMYLEETVPHRFRLCTSKPVKAESLKNIHVGCPYCGEQLIAISDPKDGTRHMLMRCECCS